MLRSSSRRRLRRLDPVVAKPLPPISGPRHLLARLVCGHVPAWPVYLAAGAVTWLLIGPIVATAILGYLWMGHRVGRMFLRRAATKTASQLCGVTFAGIADELRAGRSADASLFTGIQHIETVAAKGACPACADRSERDWRLVKLAIPGGVAAVVTSLRAVSVPFDVWACQLAAAWSLTGSGAALGEVLDSLERELEATREAERARLVHTAAGRATVLVLTGLPAIGLAMGYVMGADPVGLLLDTSLGAGCLLIATGLQLLGWWWADRITNEERGLARAEDRPCPGLRGRLSRKLKRSSQFRLRSVSLPHEARSGNGRSPSGRRRYAASPRKRYGHVVFRWGAAGVSGLAAAWCVGAALALPVGGLLAGVVGYGLSRFSRSRRRDPWWDARYAYALSLLAALLRSGATTPYAVSAVGRALPGTVGSVFLATGAAMRDGQPARSAWPDRYADTAAGGALLRALERTSHSGAALAGVCERLAAQLRRDTAANAGVRAQRSGVVMVAPLMCCFLPAFVLLGVVPVVADVLGQMMSHSS